MPSYFLDNLVANLASKDDIKELMNLVEQQNKETASLKDQIENLNGDEP